MNKDNLEKNSNIEQINDEKSAKEVLEATVTKKGIVADKFDEEPPINATPEELDKLKEKSGIDVTYNFNADELEVALKIFQKYTIYRKNWIYSLVIGLLFITYLVRLGMGKSQGTFDIFICVICVAVLGMIWYYPINHIKTMVKTVRQNSIEDYKMSIYDDVIVFGEGETATIISYDSGQLRVWETNDLFIIGYAKQRIFLLPKRCLKNDEEIKNISDLLNNGLNNKYARL